MKLLSIGDSVRAKREWPKPFHPCAVVFWGKVGKVTDIEVVKGRRIYWVDFGDSERDKVGTDYGIGTFFYNNLESDDADI